MNPFQRNNLNSNQRTLSSASSVPDNADANESGESSVSENQQGNVDLGSTEVDGDNSNQAREELNAYQDLTSPGDLRLSSGVVNEENVAGMLAYMIADFVAPSHVFHHTAPLIVEKTYADRSGSYYGSRNPDDYSSINYCPINYRPELPKPKRELLISRSDAFDKITNFSRSYPGEPFRVVFSGESGIDSTGLTKEALTISFFQAVDKKLITKNDNENYELSTLLSMAGSDEINNVNTKEIISEFSKFGHLLGLTSELQDFTTDLSIQDEVFDQIVLLSKFVETAKGDSSDTSGKLNPEDAISSLSNYLLNCSEDYNQARRIVDSLAISSEGRAALVDFLIASGKPPPMIEALSTAKNADQFIQRIVEHTGMSSDNVKTSNEFAHELLECMGTDVTPKLAVAHGLLESRPGIDVSEEIFKSGKDLQNTIVDTTTYKDRLEDFEGSDEEFCEQYFEFVDMKHDDKKKLQGYIIRMIREFDPEELSQFVKFTTSCRTVPKVKKVNFALTPAEIDYKNTKEYIFPKSHTCFNKLDIPINIINNDETVPSDYFLSKVRQILSVQDFGNV